MKKILCIVAVLLALALVLTPKAPAASAAGTAPGDQVSVTFNYEDVPGFNGKFTFSNPAIISGQVTYTWQTDLEGDVTNNAAFFTAKNGETADIAITVSFKISASAQNAASCDVVLEYDIPNQAGEIVKSGTDKKTVTVEIPGTQPTQPGTQPTQPGTQPTQPGTQPTQPGTQPTQPGTQPTQPGTQPTQPGTQPTQPGTQPTQPGTQPTQPGTQPTQPSTQPTQPTRPTQPTTPTIPVPPTALDFDELIKQIELAKSLNEMDYTASSWEAMLAALADAEKALNAKTQEEIDAAAARLAEAIRNLVALNYKPLQDAINSTENFLGGDALGGKLAALLDRLNEAKALLGNARDQESIDAAAAALIAALEDLENALKELVGKTEIVEVVPSGDYCNISMHYVWPILFFISLALNLAFAGIGVYLYRRKKKESDDTPLVDYDIGDDA